MEKYSKEHKLPSDGETLETYGMVITKSRKSAK